MLFPAPQASQAPRHIEMDGHSLILSPSGQILETSGNVETLSEPAAAEDPLRTVIINDNIYHDFLSILEEFILT